MARRSSPPKREILPDPVYQSLVVSKFVNILMERGKKQVAENILYGALEIVGKKSGKEPLDAFQTALNNIKPSVEVKSRRGRRHLSGSSGSSPKSSSIVSHALVESLLR